MSDLPVLSSAGQIKIELRRELMEVPEWGGQVYVHELTGAEMDEYRQKMYKIDGTDITLDLGDNTVRMLCYALRDPAGNRMFPDVETGVKELGMMGSAPLERLAAKARDLSGQGDKSTKVMEGNSGAGQTGASVSASPAISAAP